jgi:hypothetical protein
VHRLRKYSKNCIQERLLLRNQRLFPLCLLLSRRGSPRLFPVLLGLPACHSFM